MHRGRTRKKHAGERRRRMVRTDISRNRRLPHIQFESLQCEGPALYQRGLDSWMCQKCGNTYHQPRRSGWQRANLRRAARIPHSGGLMLQGSLAAASSAACTCRRLQSSARCSHRRPGGRADGDGVDGVVHSAYSDVMPSRSDSLCVTVHSVAESGNRLDS